MNDASDVRTVTVRLLKDHEHAGRQYPKGQLLKVSAADRDWMAEHGVVQPEPKNAPATAKSKEN